MKGRKLFFIAMSSPGDIAARLTSEDFKMFLYEYVYIAGLRLLWERHNRKPDFPFPDTKFNPNTGLDHPKNSYDILYTWVLGRGLEACAAHLKLLSGIEDSEQTSQLKEMLRDFIHSLTTALLHIVELNKGRCPFIVSRDFRAADREGKQIEVRRDERGPADLFCAKGLISSGEKTAMNTGKKLLQEFIDLSFAGHYVPDTPGGISGDYTPFMLALGGVALALTTAEERNEQLSWGRELSRLLKHLLESYYEPDRTLLLPPSERLLNPGHALEVVGLGLQAIDIAQHVEGTKDTLGEEIHIAIEEFPRLCLKVFNLGYNRLYGGIFQLINSVSSEVVDPSMPWWSLPEAARAAVRAASVTKDRRLFIELLEVTCMAINAYFSHYLNPSLSFFPFQTRDGRTGEVMDVHPAIPEGDPLYHANLSFIDMQSVLSSDRWKQKVKEFLEKVK